MKSRDEPERLIRDLVVAFPLSRLAAHGGGKDTLSHEDYVDARKHLCLLTPVDVMSDLPSILVDAVHHHERSPYEYLDQLIYFLDAPGTDWSKADSHFKAALRRFCESESPSELKSELASLLDNPAVFREYSNGAAGRRAYSNERASRELYFGLMDATQSEAISRWLNTARTWPALRSKGVQNSILSARGYWAALAFGGVKKGRKKWKS